MNAHQPHLSQSQATELLARLYGLAVSEIGDLPSYMDQNFCVADPDGSKYILKIINSAESQNRALMEVQTQAMGFLCRQGLPTQTALPTTTTGQLMSLEDIDCGFGCQTYCVRLLNYMSGTTLSQIPASPHLLYQVGRLGATMDKVLQQMTSPHLGALQRDMFWSLANVHLLEPYLHVMDGDPLQEVMKAIIKQYKTCVQPKLSSFQKGVIHGDLSDQNIVAQPAAGGGGGGYEVSGVLDFGLLSVDCCVFEVAVSIMYLMLENPRPLDVGGAVLSGWESVWPLSEAERGSLYTLVLCRMCQSVVMGCYNASKYPDNKEYFMTTGRSGTRLLHKLWGLGKQEVERRWFQDAKAYSRDIET